MINTCFNCGIEINTDICPVCGYGYTLDLRCPQKSITNICKVTKKVCINKSKDYLGCKYLMMLD